MHPMNCRNLLTGFGVALALPRAAFASTLPQDGKGDKGVMLMNRIGPFASTLHLADSDGSGERPLLPASALDPRAASTP